MLSPSGFRCDLVILTALPVEFQAVCAHVQEPQEVMHPTTGTIYRCGTFQGEQRVWRVAVAEIGMGGQSAASETGRALDLFHPELAFFVGVAGGIKDVQLGDVVVASKVYDYEAGRAGQQFEPRPAPWRADHALEQRARAQARETRWLARLATAASNPVPQVFVQPLAAGGKVVASRRSEAYHFLRRNYGDAVAVEMEGHGFSQAVHSTRVRGIVIRGISDLIECKAEADAAGSQQQAAAHAAAFAFEVLAHFAPPSDPDTSGAAPLPRRSWPSWLLSFRGPFHDYQERFLMNHRFLDLKGLETQGPFALELASVFVEPFLGWPKLLNQGRPDLFHRAPEATSAASGTIWTFLQDEHWRFHHIVLLGAPGSGKTTILQHLGLSLVPAWRQQKKEHSGLPHLPYRLPVLLFLREHSAAIAKNRRFSLADAVAMQTDLFPRQHTRQRKEWIERELNEGQCLVLLDGLDEVADELARQAVVEWVNQQILTYPRNRFIITSRPHGYQAHPLERVMVLEVHPFTQKQIHQFLHAWYCQDLIRRTGKDDPEARHAARQAADDLLAVLRHNPDLYALTVNPLLVTMLVTIHCYHERQLPDSRAELYQDICAVFLGKRRQAHHIPQTLRASHRQVVLQALAYEMMQQEIQEIRQQTAQEKIKEPLRRVSPALDPASFLQKIEQDSGLLLQRKSGIYTFAHATFQEYLAAVHIQRQHLEATLVTHVTEKWWREVILLYCAANDASDFISACLQYAGTSTDVLELAIDCEKEALQVESEVRNQLQTLLQEGAESSDVQRRQMVVRVLLARRLRRMVHLGEKTYRANSLITCSEYQLFLDEQPLRRKPDHWHEPHFPPGQGHAPVLGVREEQARAFVTWLTRREQGPWQYRLPRIGELNEQELASILPEGAGCWLQERQSFCWAKQAPDLPAALLEEILEDAFPREPRELFAQLNAVQRIIGSADHARERLALCDDLTARPQRDPAPWLMALESAIEQGKELVRRLEQALSSTHVPDLPRVCQQILAVALALSCENKNREDTIDTARSLIRSLVVHGMRERPLSFHLAAHLVQGLTEHSHQEESKGLVKQMLDLYLNLAILEGRIRGRLPAREGILLVKEKRSESKQKGDDEL
jgi:nucleoside phosphorylase